ncbi:MAG TPA: hypothetical protein PKM43_07900 [Verrucomicrobiota bacterium]|nr:hypothetical protein [Verrucomicrobiota bacterium]
MEHLKSRAKRKFHARIRADHVADVSCHAGPIVPNSAYFEIRLADMFLHYRSEYGRSFVPLAVMASEFAYGGTNRSFPRLVGNDLLGDLAVDVKREDVSFHNTRVVGPVPYTGGDVALFVGLYRAQVDDFARKLLKVITQMVTAFDVSRLSSYVDVAGQFADGLYDLLDVKQLEYRTGDRDVFQDHGPTLFEAGYFAYVNCDASAMKADELWVQEGILKVGGARESLQPLNAYDYCLVEVQGADVRNDYTNLAFHEKWKQVRERISRGEDALAHTLFIECCQQIANSPDLTPANAEALIQAYQANYAKEVEFYGKLRAPQSERAPTVYRDAAGGMLAPQQSVMRTAQLALAAGVEEKALQGLVDLSENWNDVPLLESHETELTDDFLNKQLAKIRHYTKERAPDPKGLANALAIASVTAS